MTSLASAPWALDGARTPSALARVSSYIDSGAVEGVVGPSDFKVSALDVPGAGVQIAPGAAIMLNRYQTTPNQSYSVYATGANEVIPSASMPPSSPSAQSHLVVVSVGDPEFSQSTHPWMTSDVIPVEQRETYQYVRFWVIPNVAAGTTTFKGYASANGKKYPAYALARLDVPANTTTIDPSMVKDLRKLAKPRATEDIVSMQLGTGTQNAAVNTYMPFGGSFNVDVPEWATTAKVTGFVEGFYLDAGNNAYGDVRVAFTNGGATGPVIFDWTGPTVAIDRYGINVGGKMPVAPALQGTNQNIHVETRVFNSASQSHLKADSKTTTLLRIRFEESVL